MSSRELAAIFALMGSGSGSAKNQKQRAELAVGQSWTCPAGVTSVECFVVGQGGLGGTGAGGGSGGVVRSIQTVVPGTTYSWQHGAAYLTSAVLAATVDYRAPMMVGGAYAYFIDTAGFFYRSTDYGITWTKSAAAIIATNALPTNGHMSRPKCSPDGRYILVFTNDGKWIRSADYGVTWSAPATVPGYVSTFFGHFRTSSTFQHIAVRSSTTQIAVSHDYGATWTAYTHGGTVGSTGDEGTPYISENGQIFGGTCVNGNNIVQRITKDGGATWNDYGAAAGTAGSPNMNGTMPVMSGDGSKIAFGTIDSAQRFLYSKDGGATWTTGTTPAANWYLGSRMSLWISLDGTKFLAMFGSTNYSYGGSFMALSTDGLTTMNYRTNLSWAGTGMVAFTPDLSIIYFLDQTASTNWMLRKSTDYGATWNSAVNPRGATVLSQTDIGSSVSSDRPSLMCSADGQVVILNGWISDDGGTTWYTHTAGTPLIEVYQRNLISPWAGRWSFLTAAGVQTLNANTKFLGTDTQPLKGGDVNTGTNPNPRGVGGPGGGDGGASITSAVLQPEVSMYGITRGGSGWAARVARLGEGGSHGSGLGGPAGAILEWMA